MDDEDEAEDGAAPGGGDNIIPFAKRPRPLRQRHDGFTPDKQKAFFKALKESGCLSDACRAAGISMTTVRRHRDKWPRFDDKVERALAIAAPKLDLIALERATKGAEEKVYRDGKLVMTRIKPSDSMLRLLMQGADPGKYGRTGQMPKKAVMKQLRKEARAEVRGELAASKEELIEALMTLIRVFKQRDLKERLAAGYSVGPDGQLVPPGYRMVADLPALPPPDEAG